MSARLRFTFSYAGFLIIAGIALMALLFYVIRFVPEGNLTVTGPFIPNRSDLLRALWPRVWQMLVALTVLGLVGGWFLAGLMLRPLKQIDTVAQRVAEGFTDERVRMRGRRDEFGALADTLDRMLDRLQESADEHRRFAANASHELRTPYAIERSLLDLAIADPDGIDVRQLVSRLDVTNRRGTDTVDALLMLASLDAAPVLQGTPVDIAELAADVIAEQSRAAHAARVTVLASLGEGDIDGDARLIRQLISNLLGNAIRYNVDSEGIVELHTHTLETGEVELRVRNTGPAVSPEQLPELLEPFVRGRGRTSIGAGSGSGLGLSIVDRIVSAHRARVTMTAQPLGGLDIRVVFPVTEAAPA